MFTVSPIPHAVEVSPQRREVGRRQAEGRVVAPRRVERRDFPDELVLLPARREPGVLLLAAAAALAPVARAALGSGRGRPAPVRVGGGAPERVAARPRDRGRAVGDARRDRELAARIEQQLERLRLGRDRRDGEFAPADPIGRRHHVLVPHFH